MASNANDVLSSLQTMGYSQEYIQRAMTVHNKSKLGTNYDLSIMVEIISRLKSKDKSQPNPIQQQNIFIPNYTQIEALKLNLLDTIDFRFENGRFVLCKIIEKQGNMLVLHPLGHPITVTKHDRYCNAYSEYYNLAAPKSISLRKSIHHFKYKIDDYIDCNPLYKSGHKGWYFGRIIKIDQHSSQIKVFYHNINDNKYYSYWFHIDNTNEIAAYNTKCNMSLNDENDSPKSFKEHKENIDVHIHHSPVINGQKEPKYSFLYDSIASGISNNSLHSDIPYTRNDKNTLNTQKQTDIITNQLHKFGYNEKDIKCAQQNIPNPKDINGIVDYIDAKNDKVVHEQWDDINTYKSNTYDEQYCNTGNTDNVMDMFEDEISEIDMNESDEKREYESSRTYATEESDSEEQNMEVEEDIRKGIFAVDPLQLNAIVITGKDYSVGIPEILIYLRDKLFNTNAHLMERIFRIERDKEIINNMINILTNNNIQILNNIHGLDGYIIANLICQWYKLIPNTIINVNIKQIQLCKNMQIAGNIIENEINEPYKTYFKWLLDLCIDITIHEKINKMSIKNISDAIAKWLLPLNVNSMAKFLQLCILWRRFQK